MLQTDFAASPAPAEAVSPPKKVRRVGTFAFALVLIIAGAALLAYSFVPDFSLTLVLKCAPAVLIVLGIEVLVYAARPSIALRYDWVSMLACAFILLTVGAAAITVPLLGFAGPWHSMAESRLGNRFLAQAEAALRGDDALTDAVSSVSASLALNHAITSEEAAWEDGDSLTLFVTLRAEDAPDAESFAALCQKIVTACTESEIPVTDYRIDCLDGGSDTEITPGYALYDTAAWLRDLSAEQIAERVSVYYNCGGSYYATAEDALDILLERSGESLDDAYSRTFGSDPTADYRAQYGLVSDRELEGNDLNDFMSERLACALIATPETAQP